MCVCVRERETLYVCACVLDMEGCLVFASRALVVVVGTAVYLTGYSDYVTGFIDTLSPSHRSHTGVKMSSAITA